MTMDFEVLITNEALTYARIASTTSGWYLKPKKWSISRAAGEHSRERTTNSMFESWVENPYSGVYAKDQTKIQCNLVIPPDLEVALNTDIAIGEIYFIFEDYYGNDFLFAIAWPKAELSYTYGISQTYSFVFNLINSADGVEDIFLINYSYPQDIEDHNMDPNAHPDFMKLDGSRLATNILAYEEDYSPEQFTEGSQLVTKSYVDSSIIIPEDDNTDLKAAMWLNCPVGTMMMWPGEFSDNLKIETTDEDGNIVSIPITYCWKVRDGSAMSAEKFPDLFRVLGYRYGGSGDTFYLPHDTPNSPYTHGLYFTTCSVVPSKNGNSAALTSDYTFLQQPKLPNIKGTGILSSTGLTSTPGNFYSGALHLLDSTAAHTGVKTASTEAKSGTVEFNANRFNGIYDDTIQEVLPYSRRYLPIIKVSTYPGGADAGSVTPTPTPTPTPEPSTKELTRDDIVDLFPSGRSPITSTSHTGTIAYVRDGNLYITGRDDYGQQNDNRSGKGRVIKHFILRAQDVAKCYFTAWNTYIIKTNGELWGCGINDYYQLGISPNPKTPVKNLNLLFSQPVKDVACSRYTTWLITADNKLYGCGYNGYYQQGNGNKVVVSQFTDVKLQGTDTSVRVKKVVCSQHNTWFITTDGDLYGAGRNYYGNQGSGNKKAVTIFTKRASNVVDVQCTDLVTWYLTYNGDLYGCGENGNGQQAASADYTKKNVTDVLEFTPRAHNVLTFSCCDINTYYIDREGDLYGCGANGNYQIPHLQKLGNVYGFVKIPGFGAENLIEVKCSKNSVWTIDNHGALYSAGDDSYGRQGNGKNKVPTTTLTQKLVGQTNTVVVGVCSTPFETWCVSESGDLYGCGYNGYYQQGNDTKTNIDLFTRKEFYNS